MVQKYPSLLSQSTKLTVMDRVVDVARLWRNTEGTREGKYLVIRRDGTIPDWPYFVIGAKDPAAPMALYAYADAAEQWRMDPEYVQDIRDLASLFNEYRHQHSAGDPDAPRHRKDDPATIEKMKEAKGS